VVIVDDHERSRAAVRAAIWSAGGEVVGEATRCRDVLPLVREMHPGVVVCAVGLPDGDGVDAAAEIAARAREAGVMAFLLKPLRQAELAPALDLAIARFAEAKQLRDTLEGRKVIERAKGALMTRYQLSEEEAFRRLRRAAMDSRRPMVEIAKALLVSESVARDVPAH
jgi:AmiR/NasT family two-component response regulator